VPFTTAEGAFLLTAFYLRLWVENVGNTTARQVEVYAKELRRKLADGRWQRVDAFPPMNLKWSDVGGLYFARIAAKMGKHCDLGHIVDPARRSVINENAARLALNDQQTSLTFDLIAQPNHKGHIIGPGEYELDLLVAADNARPSSHTVTISLPGRWYEDETRMLRDGVGVAVKSEATFNVNY